MRAPDVVALSFTSLLAADCVALAAYYRDVFDLPRVPSLDSEHFRGLRLGPTILGFSAHSAYGLLELPRPSHPDDPGIRSFLTFEVDDAAAVDTVTAKAAARGATVRKPPYTTYYGAYQSVLTDPEGNAFRINHLVVTEMSG